jgi:endonuclease/exonuclease/phosphatase family metal-dependent hydrolase
MYRTKRKARSVTAKVELDKGNDLYLTCLHLDHRKEPTRLEQIRAIRQELDNIFTSDHCQIWTGDYNALTKEDYTGQNWQNITDIRARNGWELPQIDVTSRMKKDYGFKDTWAMVGCPRPIKTCRFDTRIDYIYANPKLLSLYDVQNVLHIDDTSSDHNMVKTTFTKKN